MLKSDLCDYSNACIVGKVRIAVEGTNVGNKKIKKVTFENNAPFKLCISKTNSTFVGNTEDLNIAMLMYNLLEYSDNHSVISERLWSYYRHKVDDAANEIVTSCKIENTKTRTSTSFEYKIRIKRRTSDKNTLNVEVVVPLKYLSSFWKFLSKLYVPIVTVYINDNIKFQNT